MHPSTHHLQTHAFAQLVNPPLVQSSHVSCIPQIHPPTHPPPVTHPCTHPPNFPPTCPPSYQPVHPPLHPFTPPSSHPSIRAPLHSPIHTPNHPHIPPPTHPCTHTTHACMCSAGDGSPSPKPERSAMSSMGFTRSQPSQTRLPSFTGLRTKASSCAHAPPTQRSGPSFGRRGLPSFTREATPVSHSLHNFCCSKESTNLAVWVTTVDCGQDLLSATAYTRSVPDMGGLCCMCVVTCL